MINFLLRDSRNPYYVKYKQPRTPDLGNCKVMSIDWDEGRLSVMSKGDRYFPEINEVQLIEDHPSTKIQVLKDELIELLRTEIAETTEGDENWQAEVARTISKDLLKVSKALPCECKTKK